jgi:hypothetical protein
MDTLANEGVASECFFFFPTPFLWGEALGRIFHSCYCYGFCILGPLPAFSDTPGI